MKCDVAQIQTACTQRVIFTELSSVTFTHLQRGTQEWVRWVFSHRELWDEGGIMLRGEVILAQEVLRVVGEERGLVCNGP